ncbi:hypothetical protein OG422_31490 (plasmid) [Streptomyces sp. NBC_01525]|uniref:hypothetical protein n=1 Tax=Streptomyces sp. NBC_01525 TaxID=2903893 RepID=UPI002F90C638
MLPAQSTTDDTTSTPPAADDADALLARAHQHVTVGEYDAATAFAALATAAYTARAVTSNTPLPIYPGSHEPGIPWCQECSDPRSREVELENWTHAAEKRCPRCNIDGLRARPCRYCGTYLEHRLLEGPLEKWRWVDSHNNQGCQKAPHPLDQNADEEQPDVWPQRLWANFIGIWKRGGLGPATASELIDEVNLRKFLPRTTYGDVHRDHLERWLIQRAGADHDGLTLVEHTDPATGELTWTVEPTASTEASSDTE